VGGCHRRCVRGEVEQRDQRSTLDLWIGDGRPGPGRPVRALPSKRAGQRGARIQRDYEIQLAVGMLDVPVRRNALGDPTGLFQAAFRVDLRPQPRVRDSRPQMQRSPERERNDSSPEPT
jgi:hypothetical protein